LGLEISSGLENCAAEKQAAAHQISAAAVCSSAGHMLALLHAANAL